MKKHSWVINNKRNTFILNYETCSTILRFSKWFNRVKWLGMITVSHFPRLTVCWLIKRMSRKKSRQTKWGDCVIKITSLFTDNLSFVCSLCSFGSEMRKQINIELLWLGLFLQPMRWRLFHINEIVNSIFRKHSTIIDEPDQQDNDISIIWIFALTYIVMTISKSRYALWKSTICKWKNLVANG